MHDSVITSETSFFLKWFNFENCFSKLMTIFVESCFYYLLFLTLILSLVCKKNQTVIDSVLWKNVLENNRYVRFMSKFVVKILKKYMWKS